MNVIGTLRVVDPAAYSASAVKQRQRRLARVRLAELVAERRATRTSVRAQPPALPDEPSPAD